VVRGHLTQQSLVVVRLGQLAPTDVLLVAGDVRQHLAGIRAAAGNSRPRRLFAGRRVVLGPGRRRGWGLRAGHVLTILCQDDQGNAAEPVERRSKEDGAMGLFDKAKKMAEKAAPLLDKAAPHAREAMDKAGQQIDKRTGGKYHDKLEQAEEKVGELADKRMAANGTAAATADDAFPATPPAATADAFPATPAGATTDDGFPATPVAAEEAVPTSSASADDTVPPTPPTATAG
jgi:MT0933-like antitoxin protein